MHIEGEQLEDAPFDPNTTLAVSETVDHLSVIPQLEVSPLRRLGGPHVTAKDGAFAFETMVADPEELKIAEVAWNREGTSNKPPIKVGKVSKPKKFSSLGLRSSARLEARGIIKSTAKPKVSLGKEPILIDLSEVASD
ncbi:hypothetical protein AMTR_s00134p00028350 [Amborella trichopoda]|uniref:Uncharacterized protein n=1 Tax=Amborella trichopoda TaxID=13333 RepID=W1P5J1_AMBTC|nr:hypothetical protein AMTR_s00134p00028350 [Amborella trichopoda]